MEVTEAALLKSGFNHAELRKLKSNISNYGGTLDSITFDLAKRFNAAKWVTIVALFILIITLMLASGDASITLTATLAIVLPFIWYLTPAKLAHKS